ncbi:hypothetical protein SLOPH_1188, partial [Spraguea lophii 42_110]
DKDKDKDKDKDNNNDNKNSIIETIPINTNTEENKHTNHITNNNINTYNNHTTNHTNTNNNYTTTNHTTTKHTTTKHTINNTIKNNRNIPSDIQISHSFIKSFSIDYSKNINYNYIKKYYFPTWMNRLCKIYLALKSIYKFNSNKNITTILSVINKSLERMVGYRVSIEDIIKINNIICDIDGSKEDDDSKSDDGDNREDSNNTNINKHITNTTTKHTTTNNTTTTTNKHTNNKNIKIINIIEINNEYILYPLLEENEFYAICYEYIKIQYKIFIKDNEDNEDKSIMFNPRAIADIDYNRDSGNKSDKGDTGDGNGSSNRDDKNDTGDGSKGNKSDNSEDKGDKDNNPIKTNTTTTTTNNTTTNTTTTNNTTTNNTPNNIAKNRCMNILNRIRNREIERRNRYILSNKNNDIRDRVLQVFSIEDKRCIRLEYLYSRLNRITDNKILLRKYIIDIKELEIRKIENEEYVFHI